jgi:hypothetical protein
MKILKKLTNDETAVQISANGKSPNASKVNKKISFVAILVFAVLVSWITYNNISNKSSSKSASIIVSKLREVTPFGPEIVSADDVKKAVSTVGHALYWVGEKTNHQIEMTITKNGSVYIRYLPLGVKVGTKEQFLTIATYSDLNGYAHVQASAKNVGTISQADSAGAFVVESSKDSLNAYFAYNNYPIQVEVFTTTPGKAWNLIQTGQVRLVK